LDTFFDNLVVADSDFIATLIVGSWLVILVGIAGFLMDVASGANVIVNFEGGEEEI
jgi:hypothetical protein